MIICVCNNISDREIGQAVALGVVSMDQLQRDLGVATCCGKCESCAREVLLTHIELHRTPLATPAVRTAQTA